MLLVQPTPTCMDATSAGGMFPSSHWYKYSLTLVQFALCGGDVVVLVCGHGVFFVPPTSADAYGGPIASCISFICVVNGSSVLCVVMVECSCVVVVVFQCHSWETCMLHKCQSE